MTSLVCPQCGKDAPPEAKNCPGCGFALWSAPGDAPRKKTPKWVWWVIGIAVGCLVLCVGSMFLVTLLMPKLATQLNAVQRIKAKVDVQMITATLEQYVANNGGKYPDSLEVLVTPDANGQTYFGKRALPLDPWNRAYVYEMPTEAGAKPRVVSYARDGKPGGTGEDTDIDASKVDEMK